MPDATSRNAPSIPISRGVAMAIRGLASRAACIHLPDDAGPGSRLAIIGPGHRKGGRPVAFEMFAAARRFGWIVADAEGSRLWRLTIEGAAAIRRVLSEPGEPSPAPAPAASLGAVLPGYDPDESPLAWLRRRRDKDGRPMISEDEFRAGERLRAELWRAEMTPRTTTNWSAFGMGGHGGGGGAGAGVAISDGAAAAQARVRAALDAVGTDLQGILVDTCGHLKGLSTIEQERGWPQRSGKIVLQLALRALARHYGYLQVEGPVASASGIRHWAPGDYRPNSDSWR